MKRPITKSKYALLLIAMLTMLAFGLKAPAQPVKADINEAINFVGKVTDTSGVAVANGAYDVSFNLYTTATGTSAIWSEDLTAANMFSATIDSSALTANTIIYTYSGSVATSTLRVGQELTNSGGGSATIISFDTVEITVTRANSEVAWANSSTINNRPRVDGGIINEIIGTVSSLTSINFNQTLYLEVTFNSEVLKPRKLITSTAQAFNSAKLGNRSATEFSALIDNEIITGEWSFSNILSIATSSTNTALTVTQSSTGDIVNIFDGVSEIFTILDGGNVGIGTTSPYAKLSVVGEIVGNYFTATSTTATSTYAFDVNVSGVLDATQILQNGVPISSVAGGWTDGGTNVYLTTISDNVGIGTSSPYAKLSVVGQTVAEYFTATSTTATSTFQGIVLAKDGGSVGIGTSSPSTYFSVASGGDTYFAGNVGIGTAAPATPLHVVGRITQTGLGNSVFIGEGAGAVDDLTNNTGVFVGYQAGYANTTGWRNTLVGYQAGDSITTAAHNTVIGYQAGSSNVSSWHNTLIGEWSGEDLTGQNNTFLGAHSGWNSISADNNIIIGYWAGDNLTTGDNNIVIGYLIDTPAVDSANTLNIGNLIYGTGVDGTATTLSSGNIGIGTSSPYAKLSVVGETVSEYFTATSTTATSTFSGGLSAASSLYILQNGNVGIGTNEPVADLHIYKGSAGSDPTWVVGDDVIIESDGGINLQFFTPSNQTAWLQWSEPGDRLVGAIGFGHSGSALSDSMWFTTTGLKGGTGVPDVVIGSTGNLGIGTTSPYAKLSVVGETVSEYFTATSTTATSTFSGGFSAASSLYVLQNGNVGIGTAAPSNTLEVAGAIKLSGTETLASGVGGISKNATNGLIINAVDGSVSDMTFTTLTGNSPFFLEGENLFLGFGSTKIGIGTVTEDPSGFGFWSEDAFMIDIDNIEAFLVRKNGDGGDVFVVNTNSGNVGIGTSSPYAKLSVVGETVAEYFTATSTTATSTFAFNIGSPTGYNLTLQSTDITGATGNILLNPYGGKVGVASSSPFATFAVEQQDNDTIVFLVADSGTSTPHLKIDGAGITTIGQLQTGAMSFDANAGMLSWVNMPVDSSVASNTIQSFTAQIDSNNILTIYALSDGVGGVTYPSVGIGTTTPTEQFSVANRMYIGGTGTSTIENNLYVMGTLRSAVQYVGDLIFANNFRFTESQPVDESPRALILKSHTLDDLLYIDEDGNMGIGTTTPAVALTVQGDAMADSWLTYEVVEMDLFPENDKDVFEEGDLLSISDETGGFVKASSYDNYPIIGIAKEVNLWNSSSTKPAILGTFTAKVSTENGDIYIGDYLTKSSIDGVAMRADVGDQTVGFALEDYYGTGIEIIKVFINVDKPGGGGESESIASESYSAGSDFSISDFFDTMLYKLQDLGLTIKNGIVQAREFVADKITAKQITTEKLCLDDLCINKDKLQEILDKNQILGTEEDVNLPAEPENLDEPLVNEEDDDTGEEENDSGGAKSEENNTDEDGKVAGEEESAGNDAVETEESSSTGGEEPPPEEVVE